MKHKVESMQQLAAMNLHFEKIFPRVENHIAAYLDQSGIGVVNLSDLIGVSRQTIHSFICGTASPNVEVALKIAHVFNVSVEQVFQLAEHAWMETAKDEKGKTIYFDRLHFYLLSGKEMKGVVRSNHFDSETGAIISEKDYEEMVKKEEQEALDRYLETQPEDTRRDALARIKEQARKKIEKRYPVQYQMLYQKIDPLVLNQE